MRTRIHTNLFHRCTRLALLGFASASLAPAQFQFYYDDPVFIGQRSASFSRSYGNSDINVAYNASARASNADGAASVRVSHDCTLEFLSFSGRAYDTLLEARRTSTGVNSGSRRFRIAGITVRENSSITSTSYHEHWLVQDVSPRDLSQTFWAGPVPITVEGNVYLTSILGIEWKFADYTQRSRLGNVTRQSAMLDSRVENDGQHCSGAGSGAWASVGVGVSGWQVGVRTEVDFGFQAFRRHLRAGTSYIAPNQLRYNFSAIRCRLKVFAEALFGWAYYENQVAEFSAGAITRDPFVTL